MSGLLKRNCSSFASAVLKVVYDMDIKDPEDPYIEMVEDALIGPNLAALPGRFLVETVPISKSVLRTIMEDRLTLYRSEIYSPLVPWGSIPEDRRALSFPIRQDHKRSFQDDQGKDGTVKASVSFRPSDLTCELHIRIQAHPVPACW